MKKTNLVIISAIVSIVLLIILNLGVDYFKKNTIKKAYIVNEDIIEGELITNKVLTKVNIETLKNFDIIEYVYREGLVAKRDIKKGEILHEAITVTKEEYTKQVEKFEYISINISEASNATGYQLKAGDMVNVYATAKTKDTTNLYKNAKKTYSSSGETSYVTFKILENVQIKALVDVAGAKIKEGKCSEVVLLVDADSAIEYSNIKGFADFNITKQVVNEL